MAEKIVSPGVFTRERDLSFLPAGVAEIGAAIVGPTVKGPAFEPVIIESFKEFEATFGPKTLDSYVPYTVEAYLKSAGRVTVVRTLGLSGYSPSLITLQTNELTSSQLNSAGGTGLTWGVLHPTQVHPAATFNATLNDSTQQVIYMHLTGSSSDISGSFSGSYFVLSTIDPAGDGTNLNYGFYFSGSAFDGGGFTQAGGPQPTVASAFTSLSTTFNKSIELTKGEAGAAGHTHGGTNVAGISASIASQIRTAINSITASGTSGLTLFSASMEMSGSSSGSGYSTTSNLNTIKIINRFAGKVYGTRDLDAGFLNTSLTGVGAETASFSLLDEVDATQHNPSASYGRIEGTAFTLFLKGNGGTNSYSSTTTFANGAHTDSGNILSAQTSYSGSIDTTSEEWIGKVFGKTPKDRVKPVYNYMLFNNYASKSYAADPNLYISTTVAVNDQSYAYSSKDAFEARTPWIVSQNIGSYGSAKTTRLFKFHTRSHGSSTNYQYKVAISNIKDPGSVAGSDYGSFSVQIRRVDTDGTIHGANNPYAKSGDSDMRPHIVEQWNNLTLDPNSPNFIARVIGDRYQQISELGKVTVFGDYPNLSRHVYVEVPQEVKDQGTAPDLVPFGFEALYQPIVTGCGTLPTASFVGHTNDKRQRKDGATTGHYIKKTQVADNVYNKKIHYGFDYLDKDNYNYLLPLPDANATGYGVGNNKHFNLSHCFQHPSASLNSGNETAITPDGSTINLSTKKFIVPFQGGFDGLNPARYIARDTNILSTNMLGFDLSTAETDGTKAYKRALNAVSNPDEYDINLVVTPGPNHRLHSAVTTHAKNLCEDRGDALYLMDAVGYDTTTIATVTNTVEALDSNYTATYWPWVKILDTDKNKPVWVPPSAVMAGVIAKNDQVAFEWFAPAGLNRGILTEAIDVPTRLTHAERDDLYEGRVNPIATFKEGICIWGQKTLQAKPSALDRINVRRLLIAAKKFIASATKYLVFENNTNATRQRFLNIANPYFESIQQRQGLYAYKVIMDATNNTPDVIDRNQMIGEIFLQPAKSAEFIILDFNILPTGAVFPE